MTNENARIHWLRLSGPQQVSQLRYKDIGVPVSWTIRRTGRIGFSFRSDKGIASIEVYEEFSYKASTNLPGLQTPQLRIEDARESKLIGTLFPGLEPGADEREILIREITEESADDNITNTGMRGFLYRILRWCLQHDPNLMTAIRDKNSEWIESANPITEKAKIE